jgi:hypothetical protein
VIRRSYFPLGIKNRGSGNYVFLNDSSYLYKAGDKFVLGASFLGLSAHIFVASTFS